MGQRADSFFADADNYKTQKYQIPMLLKLIPIFTEVLKSQGFSVALMMSVAAWFAYDNHQYRVKVNQEYEKLQTEVRACNDQIIEIYREEREKMLETIEKNTDVLSEIKNKIK